MTNVILSETAQKSTAKFDYWKPSFDHCERHKYALFPMHADTKQSAGPWRHTGTSTDPAQWLAWVKAGYMLGVSACASKIILIDVDVGKVGRDAAYDYFKKWCKSLGFEPPKPYAQSRSGGWHFAFRCPEGFEPETHRGTISIKISHFRALSVGEEDGEVISVRNRGICVAPGSVYHGQPYVIYPDPPAPDPLPPGLHELLKLPVVEVQASGRSGLSEPTDVAQLYAELDDLGEFDAEPDWFKHMGAIKLALGDTEDGKEVAWQMTNPGKRCERFDSVWARAKTVDPGGSSVCRIGTAIMRYEQITGKKFRVRERRKTVEEQFGAVIVSTSEAPLAPASPTSAPPPPPPAAPGARSVMPRGGTLMGPRGEVLPMDADDSLALDFTDQHVSDLRHCEEWGKWLRWDGARWQTDKTSGAYNLVREHLRRIGARMHLQDARKILSAKTVAAVERMAKTDPRIATMADVWDAEGSGLGDAAGHLVVILSGVGCDGKGGGLRGSGQRTSARSTKVATSSSESPSP